MTEFTHQNKIPKFLVIYADFNEFDRKKFQKLALSTYFNNKRNHKSLIIEINKLIKKNQGSAGLKITDYLSEKTGLSKRALWNRFSELTRIAEYFLIINEIESDEITYKKLLLDSLRKRKLSSIIELQKVKALTLAGNSKIDLNSYYNLHAIFENISNNYSEMNKFDESVKFYTLHSEYSVLQFLMLLFKQALELELQKINNIVTDFPLAKEVLNNLNYIELLNNIRPLYPKLIVPVEIYYCLYLSFKENQNEKHYHQAKKIFLKNKELFAQAFKNDIYQALRDYCIDKTNKGEGKFYKEIFDLNNRIMDEGLFKGHYVVNSRTNNFRNFIFAALRLEEYEWIRKFIDIYSKELPPDMREDEINLSTGILSLYEKKYEQALGYLGKVRRKRYLQYLDTSVYKLIIFYETDDIEESYKESARLKNYMLQHSDIPAYLKGSYKRFIKKFELLLKLKGEPERTDIEMFIDEMEKIKNIGLGRWLYDKGAELLRGKK
ncbi:MAG: hypothetical protein ABI543_00315 [Ignavibacteria bacterium]